MVRKSRRGTWELVLEIIQEVEKQSTDPIERWGMLKGIVQYRVQSPVLQYKIEYMERRRAKEQAHGKDD
jgi:hypothetical protein